MKTALKAVAAALLLLSGCANQTAPPGGPPDLAPPLVLKVSPQNNAVGAKLKAVVLQFDEVISETPKGGKDIAAALTKIQSQGAAFVSRQQGDSLGLPRDDATAGCQKISG